MKINLLRQLADKYFYHDYQLTPTEYKQLKNSAYNTIFENKPYDSKTIITEKTNGPQRSKSSHHFHIGVEKFIISELVNIVEDKFNLDLSHSMFNKYGKVDIEQLKEVIENFKNTTIMSSTTKKYIETMLTKHNVYDVLYILYAIDTY